jgi:hypothetical protein
VPVTKKKAVSKCFYLVDYVFLKVPLEQGESPFLSNQQRACLLSAAAAADIGSVRGHHQQHPLRTEK